jgi:hypothetical protein
MTHARSETSPQADGLTLMPRLLAYLIKGGKLLGKAENRECRRKRYCRGPAYGLEWKRATEEC